MSCNYADGLSPYENKGVLGLPESVDDEEIFERKCEELVKMIESAKHVVVHTGAGISTSAGIPDFRGPRGVWTLEEKGEMPKINISFDNAIPTKTHMALKALIEKGYVHYIVSQNIDGLHLKSGLSRKYLAELHGNMFIEQCNKCRRQYVCKTATKTVGQKLTGGVCKGGKNARSCRGGMLIDNILDWEHDLPDRDLDLAYIHSTLADLNIALGTTLQIVPSGNLPLKNKKFDGKLVICNLQPTKHDKKADMKISMYVDELMMKITKRLGIEIPDYSTELDPTKRDVCEDEWTISAEQVKTMDKQYTEKMKEHKQKRPSGFSSGPDRKPKMPKEEIKLKKSESINADLVKEKNSE